MGRFPDRLTWVLEDSGGASGDTVFPYLTWGLRTSIAANPRVFWHGTRGDQAARIAAAGGNLLPGPRRETVGRRNSNKDRTYVGVLPSHATWYAVPPHPPNSLDDNTMAWGPIALFMCEAEERQGEYLQHVVRSSSHGARLIYPRPLALLIRMDWAGPTEAKSRCRRLPTSCGMGDCAFALHLAGYDHVDPRRAAEARDKAAATRRTSAAATTWPPPEALYLSLIHI